MIIACTVRPHRCTNIHTKRSRVSYSINQSKTEENLAIKIRKNAFQEKPTSRNIYLICPHESKIQNERDTVTEMKKKKSTEPTFGIKKEKPAGYLFLHQPAHVRIKQRKGRKLRTLHYYHIY